MADVEIERWVVSGDGASWRQCHASTIVQSADSGVITAAWFAGDKEGALDNAIWVTRGTLGGVWDPPKVILRGHERSWWNPVLAFAPDGALWLFAKNGPKISRWKTWFRVSQDGGQTWSPERELVPGDDRGGRGPVKNPPIITKSGLWVAPNSVESGGENPIWNCRFDLSSDGGRHWRLTEVPLDHAGLQGAGIIQPTLWRSRNGLVAICRSSEGHAYRTTSDDDGEHWSPAKAIRLAQNNSGFCAAGLDEVGSKVALAHNPGSNPWGPRCPLIVSTSDDDGVTWQSRVTIEDGKRLPLLPTGVMMPNLQVSTDASEGYEPGDAGIATSGINEYSYPTMIVSIDGSLLVSYTWQRRAIVVACVPRSVLGV